MKSQIVDRPGCARIGFARQRQGGDGVDVHMSVKTLLRLALVTGAAGLSLAFAQGASADLVDPARPYEPVIRDNPVPAFPIVRVPATAPGSAVSEGESPPAMAEPTASEPPVVATDATPAPADPVATPLPVPAPESVVTRPAPRVHRLSDARAQEAPTPHLVDPNTNRPRIMQHVRSFLAELVSTCKVGASAGSGGPVLVLAVLGMAAALDRRWVRRARLATDERTPEFLFAWEVISPG